MKKTKSQQEKRKIEAKYRIINSESNQGLLGSKKRREDNEKKLTRKNSKADPIYLHKYFEQD